MLAGMTVLAAAAAEAATEAATEAAAHSGGGGLPQLDAHTFAPQLFWLVLTFGALYFILSRVALPRIGEVLEERADRIVRDLEAAQRLKDDTDKALADYEKALADARGSFVPAYLLAAGIAAAGAAGALLLRPSPHKR